MNAGVVDTIVFLVAALVVLVGAVGVIVARHPVHSALMLVMTLFGVGVLFVALEAHFLAAVQVIVYTGAIVVLFLFVIMLLGVDKAEALQAEPLGGQRPAAAVVAVVSVGLLALVAVRGVQVTTGARSSVGPLEGEGANHLERLGVALFTDYVFAFELTSVLLVIGVVAAVVLARRPRGTDASGPESLSPDAAHLEAER